MERFGPPAPQAQGEVGHRLVVLMAARLALSLISLGIALALEAVEGPGSNTQPLGLYGTVVFALLATVAYGLMLGRIQRPARFAAINIATDIAIVSALVHFSGGADSIFTFLYVLVAVYGALLFERRGALAAAGIGVTAYGAVLLAGQHGWLGPGGPAMPIAVLFTVWAIHAGAIMLVAALASFLAAELRRTGEALRERTSDLERLRKLHQYTVESLKSGLLTTDHCGRIMSFNPEAERITGVAAVEASGCEVEKILPGVRSVAMAGSDDAGAASYRTRMRYRNRNGADLHLGVAAYILKDDDSNPCGHVLIFQDVSDVVEMENGLRRSERLAALGQLSASIAHEIRNPLAAISGSIQILSDNGDALAETESSDQLMGIVLRETDRLNHLITDFLHYARPAPLQLEPVLVSDVVDEVLKMFETIRAEGVEAKVEIDAGLSVHADADQLRQVLWNLVLNSAQAMPDGGVLEIGAACVAGADSQDSVSGNRKKTVESSAWVEIAVSDQGVGISPEALDHVFDPFFTTKREGSGLGLSTVHRIVEDHGGTVLLNSASGRGTTIRLRFPRAEESS